MLGQVPFPTANLINAPVEAVVNTVAATPVLLFSAETLFSDIKFIGEKSFGVANTGNVTIQVRDTVPGTVYANVAALGWKDAQTIVPGASYNWPIPVNGTRHNILSFRLKVATDNDGVRIIYS